MPIFSLDKTKQTAYTTDNQPQIIAQQNIFFLKKFLPQNQLKT
ncbi:hypothetical protein AsAng_0055950 [Aureispira anguillae]|uniref:Uncharacterized protein n=1 Tax=Aureispira anguillae TaxID=2864201 RepID=A0A915YKK8_9BACT|nr:hypothetical protein AsAng_0055950 [Aureispira anguillae]